MTTLSISLRLLVIFRNRLMYMTQVPTTACGLDGDDLPMSPLDGPGVHRDGLLRETVEQLAPPVGRAPVEPERELVQISLQVRDRDAPLVDAQEPPLEQGHDAVDAGQQVVPDRGFFPDDLMDIAPFRQPAVPMPAIRAHDTARLDGLLHGTLQAARRGIGNPLQPDAAYPRSVHLGRDDDQGFPRRATSGLARLRATPVGLIGLDRPREPVAPRTDHRGPQLVQPRPGRAVAAQPQRPLEPQGTDPRLLVRHVPHGAEPQAQIRLRVLEDRPRQDRRLVAAERAVIQAASRRPDAGGATPQTPHALRPAQLDEVRPTCLLRGEPPFKLHERAWVVVHACRYYGLWPLESSA